MLLVAGIGEGFEELLVAPGAADVLWRTSGHRRSGDRPDGQADRKGAGREGAVPIVSVCAAGLRLFSGPPAESCMEAKGKPVSSWNSMFW